MRGVAARRAGRGVHSGRPSIRALRKWALLGVIGTQLCHRILRASVVSLLLLSAPNVALACDLPFQSPYDQPGSHMVDTTAKSIAVLPTYAAIGVCGALMLPADIYWKVERPAEDLGTHVSTPVCADAAAATWNSSYLVGGFPVFAVKKVFGDPPRA